MNTIKKIGLVSAVAFALFAFNACGDDSNSTSASAENGSLSSAVEEDESSSSVIPDPDRESSSSSRMSSSATTENLDKSSSSSVVIPGSSSSVILSGGSAGVEGSSSSSAKSSSSVNSSSSVKFSSSSSVKQSSSSVASSSSGEYVPFDHSLPLLADSVRSGAYKIYEDSRDGQKYYYLTINGKRKDGTRGSVTIFAQNLNYGVQIDGTENQNDDNKVEKYCYENDRIRCDEYGGLYQWAETMGLPSECNTKSCANLIQDTIDAKGFYQGICPDGWRLMTYDDYELIYWSTDKGALGIRSQYTFKGSNYTGFSLVGAGYRCSGCSKGFEGRLGIAGWYYPTEIDKNKKLSTSEEFDRSNVFASVGYSYDNKDDLTPNTARSDSKLWGFSIRCVKVNQE